MKLLFYFSKRKKILVSQILHSNIILESSNINLMIINKYVSYYSFFYSCIKRILSIFHTKSEIQYFLFLKTQLLLITSLAVGRTLVKVN